MTQRSPDHDATARAARPAAACAFHNVRRLSRLLERHFSRALGPAGVTASQFAILVAVSQTHEPSVTALGRTIGMSQSALSRQLSWMTRRDWVGVTRDRGRAQRVHLTARGTAIVLRALPRWQRAQDEVVESIGAAPWERLLTGIRHLSAHHRTPPVRGTASPRRPNRRCSS